MSPDLNKKSVFAKLWLISGVVSLGLLFFTKPHFVGSFSLGCIGMIINMYFLFVLLEGAFQEDNVKAGGYVLMLMGKFLGLGIAIFLAIKFLHVDLLGFGLGFFLVAISATFATAGMQNQK